MMEHRKVVALMHGFGEREILVPILKRLAAQDYPIVVSCLDPSWEESIVPEVGLGCAGLREAHGDDERSLIERLKNLNPMVIITGLHSRHQARVAQAKIAPCFGLIEMALPSDRHREDKRRSCIMEVLKSVDKVLLPTALDQPFKCWWAKHGPAKPTIRYGAPEPWNSDIVRTDNGTWDWRIPSRPRTTDKREPKRIVFLGQHHKGTSVVLKQVCDAFPQGEVDFLRHPRDDDESRYYPSNCRRLDRLSEPEMLDAVRRGAFAVTEYSNRGYSMALVGKRVHYVVKDPSDYEQRGPLVHLAIILGQRGDLSVTLSNGDLRAEFCELLSASHSEPTRNSHLRLELKDLLAELSELRPQAR